MYLAAWLAGCSRCFIWLNLDNSVQHLECPPGAEEALSLFTFLYRCMMHIWRCSFSAISADIQPPPKKNWCNNWRWFCIYVNPLQNLFGLTTTSEARGAQLFALKPQNSFQRPVFKNFLKHHFAWEAAGNTDNDTNRIFIVCMTKKNEKYKWSTL